MRVLSGIQPSGRLHLGNYLGAITQFTALQATHDCFFFIADWHALTSARGGRLATQVREMAADYLALGIDPNRATLFCQSEVPQHIELAWVLASVAPVALLERAHSYKDKVARGLPASVGLFTYPVLMAADILLYGACEVPAGPDQKQHIEIAGDLASKFNLAYCPDFDPNAGSGGILQAPRARMLAAKVVPGLDGQKMSKSYDNTLELFGEERAVRRKIMSMVTDSTPMEAPKPPNSPLLALLECLLPAAGAAEVRQLWLQGGTGYGAFKSRLAEAFMDSLGPARARRQAWLDRPDDVADILAAGAARARIAAAPVWDQVAAAVGCGRPLGHAGGATGAPDTATPGAPHGALEETQATQVPQSPNGRR